MPKYTVDNMRYGYTSYNRMDGRVTSRIIEKNRFVHERKRVSAATSFGNPFCLYGHENASYNPLFIKQSDGISFRKICRFSVLFIAPGNNCFYELMGLLRCIHLLTPSIF
jgi:hypothetical protein